MRPRILVAYPRLFSCSTKLNRKLNRLTRQLESFDLLYLSDHHALIKAFAEGESKAKDCTQIEESETCDATHAVIFDDGEEFPSLREALRASSTPLRVIDIKITRVINIKHTAAYGTAKRSDRYEYIGRGSYWGNPHAAFVDGESREEVVRKFRYDFENDKFLNIDITRVHELAGKRLGCFCKPAPCHGDVLAEFLNGFDDGR